MTTSNRKKLGRGTKKLDKALKQWNPIAQGIHYNDRRSEPSFSDLIGPNAT